MKKRIKARLYGTTLIQRGLCSICGDECLILSDRLSACCHGPARVFLEGGVSKETVTGNRRQRYKPPAKVQRFLLEQQENRCYWCGREFGSWVASAKGKVYELRPYWDHFIPFVITGSSQADQFVATCWICNSYKHTTVVVFEGEETILRDRIAKKWKRAKWADLDV